MTTEADPGPTRPRLTVAWFLPVRHRDYDRMPASVWIRCLQLLPHLERLGIDCVVNDRRRHADVAVFVRTQDTTAQDLARMARDRGARVVFDLCVNYFDETGLTAAGYGVARRHVDECLAMVERADAITAASAFIARRAAAFHPRVEYFPDSIDHHHFRHRKRYDGDRPPIAIWCGYSVKAHELEPVLPLLDKRGLALTLVSDRRPQLSMAFGFTRWRWASAPRDLLAGDFAIAPRDVESAYNLGHSFFKVGVFLAQGVPVLAGPVPSYDEVLVSDGNGRLCASATDWDTALAAVTDDPGLLAAWSARAVQSMEPHRTETVAHRYATFFRGLRNSR